jgi:AcrR family transcriptional regulator
MVVGSARLRHTRHESGSRMTGESADLVGCCASNHTVEGGNLSDIDAQQANSATGNGKVRPRASKRKSRSPNVEHQPRRPMQSRSLERFELIIKTLEEMLQTASLEDISFYDIAERANVSPASINYLFPTMGALRIEMVSRYLGAAAEFHQSTAKLLRSAPDPSWQMLLKTMLVGYREYLHSNRHVAEAILGPTFNQETRRAFAAENDALAQGLCGLMMELFALPLIPNLVEKFTYAMECVDALWARSYALRGFVDDEIFEASFQLQVAYLRTVLPEELCLRPTPRHDG